MPQDLLPPQGYTTPARYRSPIPQSKPYEPFYIEDLSSTQQKSWEMADDIGSHYLVMLINAVPVLRR